MSAHAVHRISPEEYLEIERAADFKSEYYDGQMFAMSGGSFPHAVIPLRLAALLIPHLDFIGCAVANSDLRVRVAARGPFVYPDLTICCGQPDLADDHKDILLNPRVVFEVLSKSSEAHDRGYKFALYRQIESLQDYVLVSQTEARIEVFSRGGEGQWILHEFVGPDAVCRIPSIDCELALAAVYAGVSFETT
jgi:Uma2 family endonuclease